MFGKLKSRFSSNFKIQKIYEGDMLIICDSVTHYRYTNGMNDLKYILSALKHFFFLFFI